VNIPEYGILLKPKQAVDLDKFHLNVHPDSCKSLKEAIEQKKIRVLHRDMKAPAKQIIQELPKQDVAKEMQDLVKEEIRANNAPLIDAIKNLAEALKGNQVSPKEQFTQNNQSKSQYETVDENKLMKMHSKKSTQDMMQVTGQVQADNSKTEQADMKGLSEIEGLL
jgi:hypothetical protein